jgi:dTDP-4-amino-4,6-dideoxygalactose transaminase
MAAFRDRPRVGSLERTEDIAGRAISLPMAPDLSDDEIRLVQQVVDEGLGELPETLLPAREHRAR